jgi:hypothetical protein
LDELKAEGLIRFAGLGGTTAYELPHIIATGAALFAEHNHNGIDQHAHDLNRGEVQGKLTPLQVGEWLAAFAAETRRAVASADSWSNWLLRRWSCQWNGQAGR